MLNIESRRYIGNKTKLSEWIMSLIAENCKGAQSFCDIFAGTGTISNQALQHYRHVIINDFLFSNNVIYKAFFGEGTWNKEKIDRIISKYNGINPEKLQDNYFSINYGNRFFEIQTAKKIGFIRDDMQQHRNDYNEKEWCILLTSLIYSIDRIANTLGHYEAYIKKPIARRDFIFEVVNAQSYGNVEIFREDANKLAREITADVVYVDPPYNSRQYSRFYHVYENLVKWDKIKSELLVLADKTITNDKVLKFIQAPARLEFLTALSIKARLPNVRVIPNYSCDDTGLPTSTAGGNQADIECFENNCGIIVEVTMAEGRTQTMMEVWPITRHLEDFAKKYELSSERSEAIFTAPTIFIDSERQIEYVKSAYNRAIRPYSIIEFANYLENHVHLKQQ